MSNFLKINLVVMMITALTVGGLIDDIVEEGAANADDAATNGDEGVNAADDAATNGGEGVNAADDAATNGDEGVNNADETARGKVLEIQESKENDKSLGTGLP